MAEQCLRSFEVSSGVVIVLTCEGFHALLFCCYLESSDLRACSCFEEKGSGTDCSMRKRFDKMDEEADRLSSFHYLVIRSFQLSPWVHPYLEVVGLHIEILDSCFDKEASLVHLVDDSYENFDSHRSLEAHQIFLGEEVCFLGYSLEAVLGRMVAA